MKQRSCQDGIGATLRQCIIKMRRLACPAGGNHRDGYRFADCGQHRQVEAGTGSVGVHARQQDLARAQLLDSPAPLHDIQPGGRSPAVDGYLPVIALPLPIDGDDDTLAAEPGGPRGNQVGRADGRGIDRDLVSAGQQQAAHIIHRADAAAHGEGDKDGVSHAAHHVDHDVAVLVARGDIQKDQLVRALAVIHLRLLHRVAGIAQFQEIDPLDHAAVLDIKAWDDAFCQHTTVLRL